MLKSLGLLKGKEHKNTNKLGIKVFRKPHRNRIRSYEDFMFPIWLPMEAAILNNTENNKNKKKTHFISQTDI